MRYSFIGTLNYNHCIKVFGYGGRKLELVRFWCFLLHFVVIFTVMVINVELILDNMVFNASKRLEMSTPA